MGNQPRLRLVELTTTGFKVPAVEQRRSTATVG
jgi:hypothetical protein